MIVTNAPSPQERFAELTVIYVKLRLPLKAAVLAAAADFCHLEDAASSAATRPSAHDRPDRRADYSSYAAACAG